MLRVYRIARGAEPRGEFNNNARPEMIALNDKAIREALRAVLKRKHGDCPNTLIVEELGVEHGKSRIDVAVLNGSIHGYEIKSDFDSLSRLPAQVNHYSSVVDKATLVVGSKYATAGSAAVPPWWGVEICEVGINGVPQFKKLRKPKANPSQDGLALAMLLWRREAIDVLSELRVEAKALRVPRARLYEMMARDITVHRLRKIVRERLKARTDWRDRAQFS
jgi:hypothetical protein